MAAFSRDGPPPRVGAGAGLRVSGRGGGGPVCVLVVVLEGLAHHRDEQVQHCPTQQPSRPPNSRHDPPIAVTTPQQRSRTPTAVTTPNSGHDPQQR